MWWWTPEPIMQRPLSDRCTMTVIRPYYMTPEPIMHGLWSLGRAVAAVTAEFKLAK